MMHLPPGWTVKPDDASIVTRQMNGIESFFNGFTDTPGCSHQVGGTMYIRLSTPLSKKEVHDRTRKAWTDLRATQPLLGMVVCPGSIFEFKDIQGPEDIEAWANRTFQVHTVCDSNVDLDACNGARYRNDRSDDFLPGKTGNWSDCWIMIPKKEPIENLALSLRVHHAFADSGTLAILCSEMRRLLADPLPEVQWGLDEVKAKERSQLPIIYKEKVDKTIPLPEDENHFNPKSIRSSLKLSYSMPKLKVKTATNESAGCGHLISQLSQEQSKRLRHLAKSNGLTFAALFHAIVALRSGKEYADGNPDESSLWFNHLLLDCRSALVDKKNIAMSASADMVALPSYVKAFHLCRDGKQTEAILLLAKEAMDGYGPCRSLSYRAKVAQYSDELFAEVADAMPKGEYALDKQIALCYNDSLLDQRYIQVDVPTSRHGIESTILDYDTTLHLNIFNYCHVRTWSFLGMTKICLDYAYKFWPHDEAKRLLDLIHGDVVSLIEAH